MKRSEIFAVVYKFGKAYRENLGTYAVDLRETLFNTSALLGLNPKSLMRALVTESPRWKGVPKSIRAEMDLALRLMSAEDETIRTIGAVLDDPEKTAQGLGLLGDWVENKFRRGVVHTAIQTAKPYQKVLKAAYPDLDEEDLLFFLLEQYKERLTAQPTKFKDSGLVGDILQKMLL
jgi:hypothetical protein